MKTVFRTTFRVQNNGKQTSGLSSVVLFVALGCSGQSFLLPLHRPLANKKKSSQEKWQLFFSLLRSQSSHVHFLRSSWLLHPQHKPAREMRVSVCVHRPLFFQRLLFRPAINLNRNANADLNYLFREKLHFFGCRCTLLSLLSTS